MNTFRLRMLFLLPLIFPHVVYSAPITVATCKDLKAALAGTFNPISIKAGVTIDVSAGTCTGGLGTITRAVTIKGIGNPPPSITGGNKVEIFVFEAGSNPYNFTISNLQLSAGLAGSGPSNSVGGCVSAHDNSIRGVISGVSFSNCKATQGGAIFMNGGDLTVTSSTFTSNRATGNGQYGPDALGGAICLLNPGVLSLTGSTFLSNLATMKTNLGLGGAVYTSERASVSKSTFISNRATSTNGYAGGGAVYNKQYSLSVDSSTFTNNYVASSAVDSWGGAIATSSAVVTSSSFTSNSINSVGGLLSQAPALGGALYTDTSASITSSAFFSNSVKAGTVNRASGGAVAVDQNSNPNSLYINSCTFNANSAFGISAWGGAVFSRHVFIAKLSVFIGNSATTVTSKPITSDYAGYAMGGAIYSDTDDTTYSSTAAESSFHGNSVQGTVLAGGGAISSSTHLADSSNEFVSNSATVKPSFGAQNLAFGGAIFAASNGNLTSSNGFYTGNAALSVPSDGAGGALASNNNAWIIVNNGTFVANTAASQCTVGCVAQAGGGGAIFTSNFLSVAKSVFSGNKHTATGVQANANGGAISLSPGSSSILLLRSSSFNANSATSSSVANGGAVCVGQQNPPAIISGITFHANSAQGSLAGGGGLSVTRGDVNVTSCTFDSNAVMSSKGDAFGGGMDSHLSPDTVTVLGSSFVSNSAASTKGGTARGGGLMYGGLTDQASTPLYLANSSFTKNSASSSNPTGGALCVGLGPNPFAAAIASTSFAGNHVFGPGALGGAVFAVPTALVSFCRGNSFPSSNANYKQLSPSGPAVINDLDATTDVYFCPIVPALSYDSAAFAPIPTCNQCPCIAYFNPCDPGSQCLVSPLSGFVYCKWHKRTRGNGFTAAGSPSLCYSVA